MIVAAEAGSRDLASGGGTRDNPNFLGRDKKWRGRKERVRLGRGGINSAHTKKPDGGLKLGRGSCDEVGQKKVR